MPVILNPAFTGMFWGDYRINGISRSEKNYLSQDINSAFSIDFQIKNSKKQNKDKCAIGISALSSSDSYLGLIDKQFFFSFAYFKSLDEDGIHQLGIGLQSSFITKKLEPPTYIFASQMIAWENTGFIGVGINQQNAITVNLTDFNIGLSYQNLIKSKHLISIGVSFLHFSNPKKKFNGADFELQPQLGVQIGIDASLVNNNKILGNFSLNSNLNTHEKNDISIGLIYQIKIGQSINKLNTGIFYKDNLVYGNCISPLIGLKFKNINLNFLYDINISRNISLQKNAFEVGMVFSGISKNK